jgi:hypothetical protein
MVMSARLIRWPWIRPKSHYRLLALRRICRHDHNTTCENNAMKIASALVSLLILAGVASPSSAQNKSGAEKLYIINCGEGVSGDISRWSPGVNVGKPQDFSDNCYLIKHAQGWFLWDTGITDAIAAMPQGQAPANPGATHWYRPKTLSDELEKLGVKPADLKYVAVSHTHPDHIGNVELFPQTMLLVQKAEYEWPSPFGARFKAEHPGHEARWRPRRVRGRVGYDSVYAGTYARPSVVAREAAKDRRAGTLG